MKQKVYITKEQSLNGYPSRDLKNTEVVIVSETQEESKKSKKIKKDKAPIDSNSEQDKSTMDESHNEESGE